MQMQSTAMTMTLACVMGLTLSEVNAENPRISIPDPSGLVVGEESRTQWKMKNGIVLMRLLGVPDGDDTLKYSSWIMPTSIVTGTGSFKVETLEGRWFSILDTNSVVVADGCIYKEDSEKTALRRMFGEEGARYSLSVRADMFSVRTVCDNLVCLASSNSVPQNCLTHFASRNIGVSMRAQTNALYLATSLINAGVPENERISLSPQTP